MHFYMYMFLIRLENTHLEMYIDTKLIKFIWNSNAHFEYIIQLNNIVHLENINVL